MLEEYFGFPRQLALEFLHIQEPYYMIQRYVTSEVELISLSNPVIVNYIRMLSVLLSTLLSKLSVALEILVSGKDISVFYRVRSFFRFQEFSFLDYKAFSPLKVDRRFRGTCCLYLQDRIISLARNQHEAV
jgi:hypothetical protein